MNSDELIVPKTMDVSKAKHPLNIAIVYSRFPIPMTRADQMTVAHLIEFLYCRGHNIDLYTLTNRKDINNLGVNWLKQRCKNVYIYPHGFFNIFLGLLKAVFKKWPLQVGFFYNRKQKKDIKTAFKNRKYDIGYAYYLRSAEALRGSISTLDNKNGKIATFLAMQLSQSLNTRRMVSHYTNIKDLLIYSYESKFIRRYEASVWADFSKTVLIGEKDVDEILNCCRENELPEIDNYIYSAHGVDIERFSPSLRPEINSNTIVFSGAMMTKTNVNAVEWFVKNVWPTIKKSETSIRLVIVGRNPAPEIQKLKSIQDIEVTGEVKDPAEYIGKATLCINPMQAGAGMQNKLIEYLSMAKAVVATSIANEGIGAKNGEHLEIADSPNEFAQKTIRLLRDEKLRSSLGKAARKFIEKKWTWEAHFLELESNMFKTINKN